MSRLDTDIEELRHEFPHCLVVTQLPSGAQMIEISNYQMPEGWDTKVAKIIFLAPAGYPAAQPDCFWVEPGDLRFNGGQTPQSTNNANPIPEVGLRNSTWFSWHVQTWNPNKDTLMTFFKVIEQRLSPPR